MGYKESKFNLIAKYDGRTLIFNSLKNTFTAITGDQSLIHEKGECISPDKMDVLINQGVFLEDSVNENKLAYIKYVNLINSDVLHLIILPTFSCNFRCTYCYEEKNSGVMTEETIDSIVAFVKKKIKDVRGISVSWFGGEPLLCMPVIAELSEKLMEITRFYKKTYFADITSNGYFLTEENLRKLLKYNVIHYQITIDGNKDMHDKTRHLESGKGTYDTILDNLKKIHNNVTSRVFTIVIRTNLTNESINDIDQFAKDLAETFGADNRFAFMFRRVGNWGGEEVKNILTDIIDSEDVLIDKLLNIKTPLYLSNQFAHFDKFPFCYAACENNFVFTPKGQVLKCTVDLDSEVNHVAEIKKNGNMQCNANHDKWIYAMAERELPDKCEECKLYANCFVNTCPLVLIQDGTYTPAECNHLEKELMVLYKMRRDKFLEMSF